ncbi:MAG: hypothetical protein ABUS47_09810 [Steroidobacter sp.]
MFFGKPKSILSVADDEWQRETFRWLVGHLKDDSHSYKLITPTRDYFPDRCSSPKEVVENTFKRVLEYSGMTDWPCVLQAQEYDPNPNVGRTLVVQGSPQSPAGTFRLDEQQRAIITFNPALVSDVQSLVATFAHELAHYKLAAVNELPPGGKDNIEFATDLAALFMGFGIFLIHSAFQFRQYTDSASGTQGWSTRRAGYLMQPELVQALALFVLHNRMEKNSPAHFLRSAWKGPYRKSIRYLESIDAAGSLRVT